MAAFAEVAPGVHRLSLMPLDLLNVDIPLSCGEGDRDAVESGDQTLLFPDAHPYLARLADRMG